MSGQANNTIVHDATEALALRWLMRVSDAGATQADRDACARWRAASPAHERAYRDAEEFWTAGELTAALRQCPAGTVAPRRASWRRSAIAAGLFAILAAGVYALLPGRPEIWLLADYRAPLYGLRSVTLADGTRIHLDRGAAIDNAFTATQRTLYLRQGNIVVDATHDAARPLVVRTAHGEVEVIGTKFLVAHRATVDRVVVQSGRVAVRRDGSEKVLGPGQSVAVGPGFDAGIGAVEAADANVVEDIATGWRSFEAAPLARVLTEIGRYRLAPLILGDAKLNDLRVTARLQVAAPERALAALAGTLPLTLREFPAGIVVIAPRD